MKNRLVQSFLNKRNLSFNIQNLPPVQQSSEEKTSSSIKKI